MNGKRITEWVWPVTQNGDVPDRNTAAEAARGGAGKDAAAGEKRDIQVGAGGGIHPIVRGLLYGRGIQTDAELSEFLSARPQMTFDPFLMKDMDRAVNRILQGLEKGERICIYGDYDADGVTSSSLMMTILGKLTDNLTYYIPSRFDEGYGLNEEAVKSIGEDGVKLMITVDCGSVSFGEVELAKELGMDVIVTDHHNVGDGRAADCILVNPKQRECQYPFKELAGCGVAFKVAQALQRTLERQGDKRLLKADVTDTLDLVAVATIGDIVPLTGENRSLVKYGLNVLNQGKRPGLRALIEGVGLELGKIKSGQVAYIIVPHLNAAGRMVSAKKGVELLMDVGSGAGDDSRRAEAVAFLVENNKERKRVQEKTFEECRLIVEENHPDDLFLVVYAPEAHEGIAGIVAGKLKDLYYRPVIIVTASGEGFLKGTGRSLEGIDLHGLLSAHSHLFERFGGHSGACGFLMKEENLDALRRCLNEDLSKKLDENPRLMTEFIHVEGVVKPADLSTELLSETEKIGPFGHKNQEPLFAVRDVHIKKIFYMGDKGQHVRFQAFGDGGSFGCVLFQHAADYGSLLVENNRIDVAGYPGINEWNGTVKIQFVIRDLK